MLSHIGKTTYDLNFRLFGVHIRVHPGFWLTAAIVCWPATGGDPVLAVTGMFCVFISVLTHEMGHALAFRRFGHQSHIVLHLLGGHTSPGRLSTWKFIFTVAAGPLAGLALAGVIWFLQPASDPSMPLRITEFAAAILLFINIAWSLLNLVPCIPLDGGLIMQALVIRYWPPRAVQKAHGISLLAAVSGAAWGLANHTPLVVLLFAVLGVQHFTALYENNAV